MRALSAYDILRIWEIGQFQHLPERALTMLAIACPEKTREELVSYPVAYRDGLLLDIRERTLGPTLRGFAKCPQCDEQLEFTLSADDLKGPDPFAEEKPLELTVGDLNLRLRLADSTDLIAVAESSKAETARTELAARCVVQANRNHGPVERNNLPPEAVTALEHRLAEVGAQAEVLLDLICPACGNGWEMIFDIVPFFWSEISAQARRLLREVHILASAYGWRETDILSLSPLRRQFYLEMVA